MSHQERLIRILNYLEEHKTMDIHQMVDVFQISRDTARRDIVKLTQENLAVRTYGGVASTSFHKKIDNYKNRSQLQYEEKEAIGRHASSMIANNELVYLDVSTTVNFITPYLKEKQITVVTNSIDCAYELAQSEKAVIHFLGGTLNKNSRHVAGYSTLERIKDYHFDKVFLGATGVMEDGIYNGFEEDIYFKRELIKHTDQAILLADHTKFNQRQHYKILDLESIDTLISNCLPPIRLAVAMKENGVEIIHTTDNFEV